jgi:ribonuclease HII
MLSPGKRNTLAKKIEKVAKDIIVLKVSPCKIDDYKRQGVNLNKLEAMKMSTVLDFLDPVKAYIDGPEKNLNKFRNFLEKLTKGKIDLVVENFADQTYPIVSAASIIAKVERDREIERLRRKFGFKGSGYPSDERTIEWMREYVSKHKKFPERELIRFSWETTKEILGEHKQRKLFGFFKKIIGKEG